MFDISWSECSYTIKNNCFPLQNQSNINMIELHEQIVRVEDS